MHLPAPNNSLHGVGVDFQQIALAAVSNSRITTRSAVAASGLQSLRQSERRPAPLEVQGLAKFREITIDVRALATESS